MIQRDPSNYNYTYIFIIEHKLHIYLHLSTCLLSFVSKGAQVLSVDVQIPIKSKESVVEKFDCLLEQNKNVKLVILGKCF